MSISRVESAIANIVAEYKTMTTANGYRNELSGTVIYGIRTPDRITLPIEVGVQLADENVSIEDDGGACFESEIDVYVEANVKVGQDESAACTLSESVLHDIKRCTAKLIKKYVNAALPWNVKVGSGILAWRDTPTLGAKSSHRVGVRYAIHLRAQDEDFV